MKKDNTFSKWLMPIFWQIFLGFYFIRFFISPLPFEGMWISIVTLFVYLVVYFWAYFADDNKKLVAAFIMIGCGVITVPYNWGASIFFQFAALYIGLSTSPLKSIFILIGMFILIFWLTYHYELPIINFLLPALMVSVALGAFGIYERNNSINKLRIAQNEAEIIRLDAIAERERISRDLHDILGHTLTVITLKLNVAKKMLAKGNLEEVENELKQLDITTRKASISLQDIVTNYKDINLNAEVNNLLLLLGQLNYKVKSTVSIDSIKHPLIEESLSLIIRESITNLIRHADADECEINLIVNEKQVNYSINDNGKNTKMIKFGNGLNGMQKRVQQHAGTMKLTQNNGTKLQIIIPYNQI